MKKQGFTLIELLAVIVILAIIALIATPIVLNIISESKESANLQSAQFYIDAVETAVAQKIIDEPTFRPTSCDIQADGNLLCGTTEVEVEISGEKPTSGTINLSEGKITGVTLALSEKTITKNTEGKLVYGEPEVQLQSGLYDEEGNLIASWDELVNEYKINLGMDYIDENEELVVEETLLPGYILSSNEYLSKGVKLVIDSSVSKIGSYALIFNTSLQEVIIPNSVTSIGDFAFSGCTSLTSITLPNSITSTGDGAFYACINLTEVIIPNSVTSIGESAFGSCESLTSITIPNSVTSIGDGAFDWCTSLTSITLPNSITSIERSAFSNCQSLKTINYTGTQDEWNSIQIHLEWNSNPSPDLIINYNYVVK